MRVQSLLDRCQDGCTLVLNENDEKLRGLRFAGVATDNVNVIGTFIEEEARTVVHVFRRYVQLRSVRALGAELDAAEIRSKRRILADGTPFGGQKLSRGALYLMLQNRIYRGETTHKGNAYPGEHQPIVDEVLWDQVQAILYDNRVDRATGAVRNSQASSPA